MSNFWVTLKAQFYFGLIALEDAFIHPSEMSLWVAIGLLGPFLFSMRFVVQWIVSEKRKTSVVPVSFWYYSIAGGVILLVYAIHKQDPVFIAGQGLGVIVYLRNLYFIHRKPKKAETPAS